MQEDGRANVSSKAGAVIGRFASPFIAICAAAWAAGADPLSPDDAHVFPANGGSDSAASLDYFAASLSQIELVVRAIDFVIARCERDAARDDFIVVYARSNDIVTIYASRTPRSVHGEIPPMSTVYTIAVDKDGSLEVVDIE